MNKKTGLMITLGPTLNSIEQIKNAISIGVKGFRLHLGSRERDNYQYFKNIRQAQKECQKTDVKVLLDFPACRPRTTTHLSEMNFSIGESVIFKDSSDCQFYKDGTVFLDDLNKYVMYLREGETLEFRGGKIIFSIVSIDIEERSIEAICIKCLSALKKSCVCTFRLSHIHYYPFSEYDFKLINKLVNNGLHPDFVALSFSSSVGQVRNFKKMIHRFWDKENTKCFAKIENNMGMNNIELIANEIDGLFVARSDLRRSYPCIYWWKIQNQIVTVSKQKNILLCIGSEFLSSYSKNAIINRSEIIDLSYACTQKPDWIMLSGETGNSKYPVETINLSQKIINNN